MNPVVTSLLLAVALGAFGYSARRRWRLLAIGFPASAAHGAARRIDRVGERLRITLRYALGQRRLTRYRLAGLAHKAIFFGFLVLLLRSLILIGRGYVDDPGFGYGLLDSGTLLGDLYALLKDLYVLAVLLGTAVFLHYRLVARLPRMTLSGEALVILAIIVVMMLADIAYDGARHVLAARAEGRDAASFLVWEPLGSITALALSGAPQGLAGILLHVGFWTHIGLVLVFLNILPYTKHFHVITAFPNVFFADLDPPGRLRPLEDIEGRVERGETLGIRRIDELSWKGILDLYTCTECGRCTDQCPAARTGKRLSPKHLALGLRDFLLAHEGPLLASGSTGGDGAADDDAPHRADLVPGVVDPEVLWACTTCGACEQECPVLISFVDKIVDMRRYVVQEKGEFPSTLQEAFRCMEVTGNPYGVGADERLAWADGLRVPLRRDVADVEILFWVGCAPATDERAMRVTRAVARLLEIAGVRWAVLGPEERCTGDVARRAGNEYLFQMTARANVEVLNGYGTKRILASCPHCYNTLKHEYPDFGGRYEVVHHTDFLAELVAEGRLDPRGPVEATIAYHDSCYLGRGNGIYDSPRAVLAAVPGVTLVEAEATRDRGMCCGAGGGQMFKEDEPGDERVSVARCGQLLDTGTDVISTACPFCMRMLTDALHTDERTDVRQLDIAEVLLQSVVGAPSSASGDDQIA
jgi:Fe-S oxidoreductase